MDRQYRGRTFVSVGRAVRITGLSRIELCRCVASGLVRLPLLDTDLAELRRVRRLQELGINWEGIEIILEMRRRMEALQTELALWEREWSLPPARTGGHFARWRAIRRDARLLPGRPDQERRGEHP